MSNYWAGYAVTGLILNESEFENMLAVYKKLNPAQTDLEKHIDDYGADCTSFVMAKYAGELMPGLQDDKSGKYSDKIMIPITLSSDYTDGVTFYRFFRPDGRKNICVKDENGEWEYPISTHPIWDSEEDCCYVFDSDKSMSGPSIFEEKPYASYEEFKQEFKNKLEKYLPEDFDWDAHLGDIYYAAYA